MYTNFKFSHWAYMLKNVLKGYTLLLLICSFNVHAQKSSARLWNEMTLEGIRSDFARPTVHARNLFHLSIATYDGWALYDKQVKTYLIGNQVGGFVSSFAPIVIPNDIQAARDETISYACYRLLKSRFRKAPRFMEFKHKLDSLMLEMGYDTSFQSTDYSSGSAAALGNFIAETITEFGLQDGSNEANDFASQFYRPSNPPLEMDEPGNPNITDPNRWQQLKLKVFIDQSGNILPITVRDFIGPEWGRVLPFSLQPSELNIYKRDEGDYWVYHDPGPPPTLDTNELGGLSEEYKWGFSLVSAWSSHLDPSDGVIWDISPGAIGNVSSYVNNIEGLRDFYDLMEGGDHSIGRPLNPKTGQSYASQRVPRGDYSRVLAEFWADGPDSETPPGHWFTILNYINDHPLLVRKFAGKGEQLDPLEWDVKAYLMLGGAMHDVAVTAWGIKGWYDYVRPVSAIRYMAGKGQSSDPNSVSFHPAGIPLIPGRIEIVEKGDILAGNNDEYVGKIKLRAWRGPNFIANPKTDVAGVGWILADNWWPYQRPSFVTPPFAGYISGHSTYSRAAAVVLTKLTGDPYFPGGIGEFRAAKNEFLVFENGPSVDVILQWATYQDAADQCSLSRIWGGIHPPADDMPGRLIGQKVGDEAFEFARDLFYSDMDGDGFYSYEDCDDQNMFINPDAEEIQDDLDNNCDGEVDELVSAIGQFDYDREIRVFPNPAKDFVGVSSDHQSIASISIFSANNLLIREVRVDPLLKSHVFSVSDLPRGLSLLIMRNQKGQVIGIKKLICVK